MGVKVFDINVSHDCGSIMKRYLSILLVFEPVMAFALGVYIAYKGVLLIRNLITYETL